MIEYLLVLAAGYSNVCELLVEAMIGDNFVTKKSQ
jgi:hypothetical protein